MTEREKRFFIQGVAHGLMMFGKCSREHGQDYCIALVEALGCRRAHLKEDCAEVGHVLDLSGFNGLAAQRKARMVETDGF